MTVDARVFPSGPLGTVRGCSCEEVNWIGWENSLASKGLAGKSERDGPDGFSFGITGEPFEGVGIVARSDLKRDGFFLDAGALDSPGAVRSTMSLIGAERVVFAIDVSAAVGGCGAGETSRSSENLTDFLVGDPSVAAIFS